MEFDKQRFQQVLFNLVENAVKFTDQSKNEYIQVKANIFIREARPTERAVPNIDSGEEQIMLEVKVQDEGIGILQEEIQKIFQPNFKTKDHKSMDLNPNSTGNGLNISAQICKAFGGSIRVQSLKGVGSCFTFNTPLYNVQQR